MANAPFEKQLDHVHLPPPTHAHNMVHIFSCQSFHKAHDNLQGLGYHGLVLDPSFSIFIFVYKAPIMLCAHNGQMVMCINLLVWCMHVFQPQPTKVPPCWALCIGAMVFPWTLAPTFFVFPWLGLATRAFFDMSF